MRFSQADSTSSHAGTPWCCQLEKKSHYIVILSFFNILNGQANWLMLPSYGANPLLCELIFSYNILLKYDFFLFYRSSSSTSSGSNPLMEDGGSSSSSMSNTSNDSSNSAHQRSLGII